MRPGCPPLPPVPAAMDWEKFRAEGHKVIDFIADYYQSLKGREIPVQSAVEPGYLQKAIPAKEAPQEPLLSFDPIMDDVTKFIVPGMTHWQHPNFYAWFPAQQSPAALLGDTIASSFNQPGFNWMASPAASELEVIVTNWLARAFGLSEAMTWDGTGGGVLQPSATEAAVVTVLAAKNRTLERYHSTAEKIDASGKFVVYLSDQAHFCMEKACRILSIWHIRIVRTRREPGGNCPMMGEDLAALVAADAKAGLVPILVSANYGTTGICATDDFLGIAKVCKEHHIWMHLDCAYAGSTAICPEMRAPLLPAFENVDSLFINGSKWFSMMTNASFFFFRERKNIVASLNATGVYLENVYTDTNAVVDFKDYHLGLGRPFRALKVYTTLRYMGIEGIQTTIRRHCALAKYLHDLLQQQAPMLELPIEAKFGFVCFHMKDDPDNERTRRLLKSFEEDRKIFLVHHQLDGKMLLRIVLAWPGLAEADMEELSHYITQRAKEISSSSS